MRVYYAHCIAIYNTLQETRDVQLLESLFPAAVIVNPNAREIETRCQNIRNEWRDSIITRTGARSASDRIMREVFKPMASGCHVLAFRSLPDGRIPAGVMREIRWAQGANRLILELPSDIMGREMSVRHTRAYLQEVGQR